MSTRLDSPQMWSEIAQRISQATNQGFEINDCRSIGGGCINQAYRISSTDRREYFIKLNRLDLLGMFVAEAKGLLEIAATETITVPSPICWGTVADRSYLILNYLNLTDRGTATNWQEMGRSLARMHHYQTNSNPKFGWHIDNTIGSTPQVNTWETDWITFFTTHRIGYQFQLARNKGGNFPKSTQLLAVIPQLLERHQPQSSIVHGDLWGGNASFTTDGKPVIFDPAIYWGDREVDLAMTELFGGFPTAFYEGYDRVYPLDPGYHSHRKLLYNLYHILNHYNLFGGSYEQQANSTIDTLLKIANSL
jgi:fructosamine-3-kinase